MRSKIEEKKTAATPAVGEYDVDRSYAYTMPSQQGVSLKSRHIDGSEAKRRKDISPAPNSYNP